MGSPPAPAPPRHDTGLPVAGRNARPRRARLSVPDQRSARPGAVRGLQHLLVATTELSLPAGVRLARHRPLLELGPGARLIGLDPAAAVLVEGLSRPLARLIDTLAAEPVDPRTLLGLAGDEAGAASVLLRRLMAAGAVVDAAADARREAHRAEAVVHVHGSGPLAAGVGAGLARAGIGTVRVVPDATASLTIDVAAGGEPEAGSSAGPVPGTVPSAVRTGPVPQRARPDLVVLADSLVPDADLVSRLVTDGVAHLPVRLRDGAGLVGPLVLPGRSPCLRCLDLHRSARDPAWPRVAARLAGRSGTADQLCILATIAVGTAQALAALETGPTPPPALGATLSCDPAAARIVRQPWTRHPDCACAARARCGSARRRGTIGA